MSKHPSHNTRLSDSSLYDEVCLACGATDGSGDKGLSRPCPQGNASPPTEDDLAIARKIIPCPHDLNPPGVQAPYCPECILQRVIAQALAARDAAACARQREADAKYLDDIAAQLRKRNRGVVTGEMHDLLEAQSYEAHAAAIRSASLPSDNPPKT